MDRKVTTNLETLDGLVDELKSLGLDGAERVIPWTLSTETVDRDGDVILQAGWDLKGYSANPVILWAHDASALPIGRSLSTYSVEKRGKPRLRALVQFTSQDENPDGYRVFRLATSGFLKAASVGFRPTIADLNADASGFVIKSAELLEASIVPIPANPQALSDLKSLESEDRAFLRVWAGRLLEVDVKAVGMETDVLRQRLLEVERQLTELKLSVPASLVPVVGAAEAADKSPESPEKSDKGPVSTGISAAVQALFAGRRKQ